MRFCVFQVFCLLCGFVCDGGCYHNIIRTCSILSSTQPISSKSSWWGFSDHDHCLRIYGCASIGDFDSCKLLVAKLDQGHPLHHSQDHWQLFRNRFAFLFRGSCICSLGASQLDCIYSLVSNLCRLAMSIFLYLEGCMRPSPRRAI